LVLAPTLSNSIQTLYKNANASIKLQHGTTHRFDIERGIRQGCPISPYLFPLPMQLLAIHIQNSNLKGISVANRSILISQLADDDTTLFLKNKDQVSVALNIIDLFSSASGLVLIIFTNVNLYLLNIPMILKFVTFQSNRKLLGDNHM